MTKSQEERMRYLVFALTDASKKYYAGMESGMSDKEYDKLYSELSALGVQLDGVGYQEPESNIKHVYPILSLKDTKSVDELLYFMGEREAVLSWKLDGISIILYYNKGKLDKAVSRGDGHMGKDITRNVLLMQGFPKTIPTKGATIVRGEGCLAVKDFDELKESSEGERYSNPRNLAAGLISATKTSSPILEKMHFIAHSLIDINPMPKGLDTRMDQLLYLEDIGFSVVGAELAANFQLKPLIEDFTTKVYTNKFPVDGLVLTLNDISYGDSLGTTAKFPKHSMAFKWPDETALTKVNGMKWSVSATGLITPVVIFEPVKLEGTIVRQASLHSLKLFEGLALGMGDILKVYKANKIIPEVEENLTRSGTFIHPMHCPNCGEATDVVVTEKSKKLYCRHCGRKETNEKDICSSYNTLHAVSS